MKYIISLIFVFCFPLGVYAQLEVFLNDSRREYQENAWTSKNYPESNSDELFIEHHFMREDIPEVYVGDEIQLRDRIFDILSALPDDASRLERYLSFLDFDSQNIRDYISAALNENIDSDIIEKESILGLELTPFESVFRACAINLSDRENIVINLLERIHNGDFSDIEDIEYSDQKFGDCIIPFPDRRRTSAPNPSFLSNQLIFDSRSGSPLRFSATLEQSASILFTPETASENLENTLKLDSHRIETSSGFLKQHGKNRILYVHQNHYMNPFLDSYIIDNGSSYSVGGEVFNSSHVLYISSSAEESERIIQNWTEVQPGIYTKILLQDDTYADVAGVITPKQSVGVTTYYAILYNFDKTPPICSDAVFSHDAGGMQRFVFPENPWMYEEKFVSFLCSDIESGCDCDISDLSCYERDGHIFSTPIALPHNGDVSYSFMNNAGQSSTACSLDTSQFVQYDFANPDVRLFMSGSQLTGLEREYVSNRGVLYNGVQISEKNYYNISDDFIFVAEDSRDISFELFEPEITDAQQNFSGLKDYYIDVNVKQGLSWHTLGTYLPPAIIDQNLYNIDIDLINAVISSRDILTRAGEYALVFHLEDYAGNKTRATWQYTILPAAVDTTTSTISTTLKNTQFANNSESYNYTLTLRDKYFNIISGREISSISHDCNADPYCKYLRTDMSGSTPSGNEALGVALLNNISDDNGQVVFSVSSLVPGEFTESFRVEFINPTENVYILGEENIFLKPLIGEFETYDTTDGWVSDKLLVNQSAGYRVRVQDINSEGFSWSTNNFLGYLEVRHGDTGFNLQSGLNFSGNTIEFTGEFTSTLPDDEQHKSLLEIREGSVSGIIISYILGGETIRYRLTENEFSEGFLYLSNSNVEENPVKITGLFQATGNTHNPDERQNISDIDSSIQRADFRKNISKHISSLASGDEYSGIKFIDKTHETDKNYVLEANPSFQTLVVKNGNILINQNFNSSDSVVGIISYIEDGYAVNDGYEDLGNIYIADSVTEINAFIYADGAVVSTDSSGNIYSSDAITRENNLNQQLTIQGSIFTRNTLAGSRELSGNYMLPGGGLTSDRDLAVQYDLYELRKGNDGCIQDVYGFCDIPHYLIIKYDTRIQSNPPPLFSK